MSLSGTHQMGLYTESATQTGMEGHSRSSSKYLLLQVWCGLLTVAVVAMAALLATIKPKFTEDGVSALKADNVSSTVSSVASQKSKASSLSYIQLIPTETGFWEEEEPKCNSCSLVLLNNNIRCNKNSLYFLYAQVDFSKQSKQHFTKSVILTRNAATGKNDKILVMGTFPNTTQGSVWVAKIVRLKEGDIISINITDNYLNGDTVWGAHQLH